MFDFIKLVIMDCVSRMFHKVGLWNLSAFSFLDVMLGSGTWVVFV